MEILETEEKIILAKQNNVPDEEIKEDKKIFLYEGMSYYGLLGKEVIS